MCVCVCMCVCITESLFYIPETNINKIYFIFFKSSYFIYPFIPWINIFTNSLQEELKTKVIFGTSLQPWLQYLMKWSLNFVTKYEEVMICAYLFWLIYFYLEDNCFTMLCWFLPYINMSQYAPSKPPSHLPPIPSL